MVNCIDKHFLISERLYKADLVTYNDLSLKDIGRLNADPKYSLVIDNRMKQVRQRENVIKIGSFFGNKTDDTELKNIVDFIASDLKDKAYDYDLRLLASKFRSKYPKLH